MKINVVIGDENDSFSREIADRLDAEFVEVRTERFKDTEIKASLKLEPVQEFKEKKGLVVQRIDRLNPNQNDCIVKIMQIIGSLRRMAYSEIDLLTPYMFYDRQHDISSLGDPLSLRDIGNLYSSLKISNFFTVNSHILGKPDDNLRLYFKSLHISVYDINPARLFAEHLRKKNLKNPLVVGPDEGSEKMVQDLSKQLNADYVCLKTERNRETGEVTIIDGDKLKDAEGRDVVIYDDKTSTGEKIWKVYLELEHHKPRKAYIAIVHLLGDGIGRLRDLYSDGIITTNSLISGPTELHETIPLESLISDYIKNPPHELWI